MVLAEKTVEEQVRDLSSQGVSQREITRRLKLPRQKVRSIQAALEAAGGGTGGTMVAQELLDANPWQPRATMDPEGILDLAENIGEIGLLQRPTVRPIPGGQYQLAFGHRRVEAVRVLATMGRWDGGVPVDVRELTDAQMAIAALSENGKRKDITPLEEYRAYKRALEEIPELSVSELGRRLNLDRSTVSNNLRVLALPQEVLSVVEAGDLSFTAAREFLCLVAEDHAHTDIMLSIIEDIGNTSLGMAPDWRKDNIRLLIKDRVSGTRVQEWRRLGIDGSSTWPQYGASHQADPKFNTDSFAKEHPQHVHTVPWDTHTGHWGGKPKNAIYGSLAWTCRPAEWVKWQAAATKPAPGSEKKLGATTKGSSAGVDPGAGSAARKEFNKVLAAHPAAAALQAQPVSQETVYKDVIGSLTDKDGRGLGEGYAAVHNATIAYLRENPTKEAVDTFLAGTAQIQALEAGQAKGLTEAQVKVASGQMAKDIYLAVKDHAPKGKGPVTASQRKELGTLGKEPVNFSLKNGYAKEVSALPAYLDNPDECRTSCTHGAQFGHRYQGSPLVLFCTNQDCAKTKLAAGKKKWLEELPAEKEAQAQLDYGIVNALVQRLPDNPLICRFMAEALLHKPNRFNEPAISVMSDFRDMGGEFEYEAWASERSREILQLKPAARNVSDGLGQRAFEAAPAYTNLFIVKDEDMGELLACLMVLAARNVVQGGMSTLEGILGVDAPDQVSAGAK